MLDKSIDRIGDWNPQLFRELKSRFSGNTLIAAVAIPILIQVIGVGFFSATNTEVADKIHKGFNFLNWIIPISLMLGGIYTIVADLNWEDKRGTLNFIRLTPQSGRNIFLGKILGIPSLIYLGVLLTIPLHLVVGMCAGASLAMMIGWYLTIGATTYLCLSLVVLYTLYGGKYPLLLTLFAALPIGSITSIYNYYLSSAIVNQWQEDKSHALSWFGLPLDRNIFLFDGFIICTLLLICYWLWITIDRKYINLASTSFKKEDSYWMNIQLQIWLLGFALPSLMHIDRERPIQSFYILAAFYSMSAVWTYSTIPLILPNKWSMQAWSHDRHEQFIHKHHHDLVRDLLWHDRSPILLAMLINVLMPTMVWGLCFVVFCEDRELLIKAICGMAIVGILTLIHTIIINFICLRSRTKNVGIIPLVMVMSWLPLVFGLMTVGTSLNFGNISGYFFLFSPFAWMGVMNTSMLNIGIVMMGQIGILAQLTKSLGRRFAELASSAPKNIGRQNPELVRTNI